MRATALADKVSLVSFANDLVSLAYHLWFQCHIMLLSAALPHLLAARLSLSLLCAPEYKQVILILCSRCSLRMTADVKALLEAAAAAKVLIVIPLLSLRS
jgi:hypothetical protein